jgi:hypothetical protein
MKQPTNFRLSKQAIFVLFSLAKLLHISKTKVIEQALLNYAEKNMPTKSILLKYAGVLKKEDAEEILQYISDRHDKDIDIEL